MIPKNIFYCWPSNQNIPDVNKSYIKTWKEKNPDFNIIKIDETPYLEHPWVKSCLKEQKYTFATDYIRCIHLYKNGGIWLDTDIECIKPFDDFILNNKHVVSWINNNFLLCHCIFGCEQNDKYIKMIADFYENKSFKELKNKSYNIRNIKINSYYPNIPLVATSILPLNEITILKNEFLIAGNPDQYLDKTDNYKITQNTYTKHHHGGDWLV